MVDVLRVDARSMSRMTHRLQRMGRMPIWIVYSPHHSDYRGQWIARLWVTLPATGMSRRLITEDSLERLRMRLWMMGLAKLDRSPGDAPRIVETWL